MCYERSEGGEEERNRIGIYRFHVLGTHVRRRIAVIALSPF